MRKILCNSIGVLMVLLVVGMAGAASEFPAPVTENDRCAVCGMFVAKYQPWICQIHLSDGRVVMFDGPKDMFVYLFSAGDYGAGGAEIAAIVVKDYYTQKWIDGKEALYVTGSDVYGPMGQELVPFSQRKAAENFLQDHHGKAVLAFAQVTKEVVHSMRKGHMMKMEK